MSEGVISSSWCERLGIKEIEGIGDGEFVEGNLGLNTSLALTPRAGIETQAARPTTDYYFLDKRARTTLGDGRPIFV